MRDRWTATTIGEFCPFQYGKGLPERKRVPGPYPVFGSNGQVGSHVKPLIDGPGVVIGRKGTVGAVHFSKLPFWPIDTTFFVMSADHRDLTFTYYLLQSLGLDGMNADSAVPGLNREAMHARKILVPPLPEQRAIAHILGTLDDKIELNRRMNETLEQMARALFKAWFVDFEPVRAKMEGHWKQGQSLPGMPAHLYDLFPDRLVDSEIGKIPEGWEVKSLDEIARFLNGLALQKYPSGNGPTLPVIKIAQIRKGNTKGADRCNINIPEEYIVSDGEVLFSWSGTLECVLWGGGRGALNQHLFKVTSDIYPKWFFYFWIHEYLAEFRNIAADKTTTMGHIQRHHLKDAKVVVPDIRILKEANGIILPLFDRTLQVKIESRVLVDLRDTLLPKLISGEIRVGDAERFLEEMER